jgi:hsp70-interacting protein
MHAWLPQPLNHLYLGRLEKAMKEYMKDLGERMKEIKAALDSPAGDTSPGAPGAPAAVAPAAGAPGTAAGGGGGGGAETPSSLAEKEALLDELVEIVESVDCARDLHKVGGLDTLLALMRCPYPSLRWRAAEVAATCMAGNPPVQRWFMDGGAAPILMDLLLDADTRVRTKALLALSALVRHYDPGLGAFRAAGGLTHLLGMIGAAGGGGRSGQQAAAAAAAAVAGHAGNADAGMESAGGADVEAAEERAAAARRLRRKALSLLQYVLAKEPEDAAAAGGGGGVEALVALLQPGSGADSDTRAAALGVLQELASSPAGWGALKAGAPALPALLGQLIDRHEALGAEDREAEADEAEAAAALAGSLAGPRPAAGAARRPGYDHVDVDPWLDGQQARKSVAVGASAQQEAPAAARQASGPLLLGPPAPPST